jgi:type 1 glutamine amidotransferase
MGAFRSWVLCTSLFAVLAACVPNVKNDTNHPTSLTRVLILSGSNNHDWKSTTPFLKKMFEESGVFRADVVEHPDSLTPALLQHYDALVDNRNVWPEKSCTWSATAKEALIHFVRNGGALITLHGAGSKCYDWPEYWEMGMARWGDSTRHGRIAPHKVTIADRDHPVTKGIRDFWTTDELWVETEITQGIEVLSTVHSDPENNGGDQAEPVVFYRRYGKGICYYNLLGHDVRAMRNTGWQMLTLRGTQWAAGKEVTVRPGYELSQRERRTDAAWHWAETDTSLALQSADRVLWQYNFNGREGKPFFHPLCTRDGIVLTALSPDDHPWHLGLWHSWKYINGLNYWEYKREDPWDYAGVTAIKSIDIDKHADHSADIILQLQYHPEDSLPLLDETRRIRVHPPGSSGAYAIDYHMHYQAHTRPVLLDRTPLESEPGGKAWGGYAGLSARLNQDFRQPEFINGNNTRSKGHGEKYSWKYCGFKSLTGTDVGLAMMAHPDNPGHPPAWFVEDNPAHPFYYFSPAPLFHSPIELAPGKTLDFRYRVIVLSGKPTSGDLQTYYEDFIRQ